MAEPGVRTAEPNHATTLDPVPPDDTFAVPVYWTPEQALAVVELLDDLRELIWAHMQLIDELRDGQSPSSSHQSDAPGDDPPF